MTTSTKLFLAATVCIHIILCAAGLRWGLPGRERSAYALSPENATPEFFAAMKRSRDDIYALSGGSPLGRTATSGAQWVSSIEQTLGMQAGASFTRFAASSTTAANFVRPFMLRSNSTDEQMTISSLAGMKPEQLKLDPKMYQYGSLYIYGAGALLSLSAKLGLLMISPDITAYFSDPAKMAALFLAGRAANIPFAAGIVILTFLIGRKLFGTRSGLIAALLCAVSPLLVFQAHIMKPYCIASFFALASMWYAIAITEEQSSAPALRSGVAAGLSMALMPLYGVVACAYMAAALQRKRAWKNIGIAVSAQAVVFAVCCPYFFINFHAAMAEAVSTGNMYSFGLSLAAPLKAVAFNWLPHQPLIAGLCMCAGMGYAFISRKPPVLTILAGSIGPTLIFIWLIKNIEVSYHISRFFVPWSIAGLILFAGLADRIMARSRFIAFTLLAAVTLHTAAFSAVLVANFSADAGTSSTRLRAAQWIATNTGKNSSFGIIYLPEPAHMPPLDFLSHPLILWRDLRISDLPSADFALIREDETLGRSRAFLKHYQAAARFVPISGPAWLGLAPAAMHINAPMSIYKYTGTREQR